MDQPPGGPMHGTLPHQGGGTSMETRDTYTFINREIRNKLPIIYGHWILKENKTAKEELHSLLDVLMNKHDIPMFLALFDHVIPQITRDKWNSIFPKRSQWEIMEITKKLWEMEQEAKEKFKPGPAEQFKAFIMHNIPSHLKASAAGTSPSHEQHLCALLESLHSRISALEARLK